MNVNLFRSNFCKIMMGLLIFSCVGETRLVAAVTDFKVETDPTVPVNGPIPVGERSYLHTNNS